MSLQLPAFFVLFFRRMVICSICVFSGVTQAAPIYSGVQNVSISNGEIYYLDFDGSAPDVEFFTSPGPSFGPAVAAAGMGDNALIYNIDAPAALLPGESIGPLSIFGPGTTFGNLNGGNFLPAGYFPKDGVTYAFLGVQFDIGSEVHYGWIQLTTFTSERRLIINDWAYESTPGTPIRAGVISSVPEPDSFSLLVFGGIAFALWGCNRPGLRERS